jgi:hypothetical protein
MILYQIYKLLHSHDFFCVTFRHELLMSFTNIMSLEEYMDNTNLYVQLF